MIRKCQPPFSIFPKETISDSRLSLDAKGLLCYLNSKPDGWNFSYESMAGEIKEDKETVRLLVKELKDLGYLNLTKESDGNFILELSLGDKQDCRLNNQNVSHSTGKFLGRNEILSREYGEKF